MGSNMADTVISAIHVYSGIHVYYFVLNIPLYMTIQAYMFIRNRRVCWRNMGVVLNVPEALPEKISGEIQ